MSALLLWTLTHPKIEYKDKIVTKVQERVRTLTKLVVSPDGTKVTTIESVSQKDTDILQERSSKPSKTWTIVATMTSGTFPDLTPTYGIGASKELILGLSGGLYGTSKGELGLILSYSF